MKKDQVTIPVAVKCLARELRENTEFYNSWRNELIDSFKKEDKPDLDKTKFLQLGIKNFLELISSIK